ncbi:hypothetical protein AMTR_s00007p00145360 [Amborella trichopoda]|uniref:cellulase n=1 Tax=Amborella trichopoda TaxID=13333 RepID=W1P606_AMBTC|nr:hypothetical protein AMTR_s00007p00145360 [Amborella trichopoda]
MLAWSAIDFEDELRAANELNSTLDAIRWGTDYLMKAHPKDNLLYGQVGDGDSDHACWERQEDMTTPRTAYFIDVDHRGSDLAGKTAAALAAATIAFNYTDHIYARKLVNHAWRVSNFS